MKLFYVECTGMKTAVNGAPSGIAYVLADDPTEAYRKLKGWLDTNDIGRNHDRELDSIRLIAEDVMYPDCHFRLVL